jgi:hypothetical protein
MAADMKPTGISLIDGYSRIREWYQSNIEKAVAQGDDYGNRSANLIRALPSADATSDLEKRAIFQEVISGLLEWAYNESDGEFKMYTYAKAAAEAAGLDWRLSTEEREQLSTSRLWPFLTHS